MNCSGDKVDMDCVRIKDCEVCARNEAKYTCPRCELRTCSLQCVNIHKKELECSGLRDKVKFKTLKKFDNIDFLNDYRLLEETARIVGQSLKLPAKSCYNERSGTLPTDLYRLKCTAQSRGIQLHYLPPNFSRRCANTSYLDHESQSLYWRVDWIFPHAGDISLTDEHVLDSTLLSASLHKFIDHENQTYPFLSFYQAAGHAGIKLLLKAERTAPNRYFLLDPSTTIRENLNGKSIIEYPIIYVVLSDHIYMYNVFSEEEEEDIRRRHRRRHFLQKRNKLKNNYLFSQNNSKEDDELELNEQNDLSSNAFFTGNMNDSERPLFNHQHNSTDYRRGRGRHNFRNRRNQYRSAAGMRTRGRGGFSKRNCGDFSEHINSGLSNNLSSVNIQSG